MFLEPNHLGFNDYTVCDVDVTPIALDAADSWTSPIACRNVHLADVDNDGTAEVHETPVEGLSWISLQGAADGTLILTSDLHSDPVHFLPCE